MGVATPTAPNVFYALLYPLIWRFLTTNFKTSRCTMLSFHFVWEVPSTLFQYHLFSARHYTLTRPLVVKDFKTPEPESLALIRKIRGRIFYGLKTRTRSGWPNFRKYAKQWVCYSNLPRRRPSFKLRVWESSNSSLWIRPRKTSTSQLYPPLEMVKVTQVNIHNFEEGLPPATPHHWRRGGASFCPKTLATQLEALCYYTRMVQVRLDRV